MAVGAAAARATGDLWFKVAEIKRLEQGFAGFHFFGAWLGGCGRERNADGVANSLLEENCERSRAGDEALEADSGFGEAEMKGIEMLIF